MYALLSSAYYFGFSLSLFETRFYPIWLTLIFLYLAVRTVEKPEKLLRIFAFIFVSVTCALGIFILIHATATLSREPKALDRMLGCFRVGRLCGIGLSNHLGFQCMVAAMLSLYGWIKGTKKWRIFYAIAMILLWVLIGMTNSRTVILSFSGAITIWIFMVIRNKYSWVLALTAALVGMVLALSFFLPSILYRNGTELYAKVVGNQEMIAQAQGVGGRDITDVETVTDRKLAWKSVLESGFRNPTRFLLGISVSAREGVNDVYEGRHDLALAHAHNGFLEFFRKLGFAGLVFLVALFWFWGRNVVRILFDKKEDAGRRFLMSCVIGTLVMALVEPGPFQFLGMFAIPIMFFIGCGYGMRGEGNEKE